MVSEIWKDIPGYEDCYQASNWGRIKSLDRIINHPFSKKNRLKGRILKPRKDRGGYCYVDLWKNGKSKCFKVHRLVAQVFLSNSQNFPQVNHKNGIKTDNRVKNLEWCTRKKNAEHAAKNSLTARGEKLSKLTKRQVLEIREKYIPREYSTRRLAREYGVAPGHICLIINRRTWKHI